MAIALIFYVLAHSMSGVLYMEVYLWERIICRRFRSRLSIQ